MANKICTTFGGDTLSTGAIITGLASKVDFGGGVVYIYIYLINCLVYYMILTGELNLEVNQFLILGIFMWFRSVKVSRLQADAALWKRFGLKVWVVFFIRHDI